MTMSFGARLRAARERQGVSLPAIAEQTKIKLSLLEALERDDVSYWPGGIFRRAWLRTYAQRIGLDPEATVREFLALYPEEEVTPEMLAAARLTPGRAPTRLRFLLGSAIEALAGRRAGGSGVPAADGRLPEPPSVAREADFQLTHPPDDVSVVQPLPLPQGPQPPLDLGALAALCVRLSCATELAQVAPVLDSARGLLQASGVVLWVRLAQDRCVAPVLTSGYADDLLAQLPRVAEQSDIPIARAVATGDLQVVAGDREVPGALAMPLLQSSGPVGVLALEVPAGLERELPVQAATRILAAQLASLLAG